MMPLFSYVETVMNATTAATVGGVVGLLLIVSLIWLLLRVLFRSRQRERDRIARRNVVLQSKDPLDDQWKQKLHVQRLLGTWAWLAVLGAVLCIIFVNAPRRVTDLNRDDTESEAKLEPNDRSPINLPAPVGMALGLSILGLAVYGLLALSRKLLSRPDQEVNSILAKLSYNDVDSVIDELKNLIKRRGSTAIRHQTLGTFLMMRERWDEALEHFEQAGPPGRTEATVLDSQILALRHLGRFDDAVTLITRNLALKPDDAMMSLRLCQTYLAANRMDEAREELRKTKKLAVSTMPIDKAEHERFTLGIEQCEKQLADKAYGDHN